ncbi:hypothetical protein GCM10027452_07190 [Micromonospora halotolerans]
MVTRGRRAGQKFLGCTRFPQCRGSLSLAGAEGNQSAPASMRVVPPKDGIDRAPKISATAGRGKKMQVGDLVVSTDNDLGPGKAIGKEANDAIVVQYFDHPGETPPQRHREVVSRASLKRLVINNETRVFWKSDGVWRSGRVLYSTEQRDIYVKGHEWEGFVPEKELFVRWMRPLRDPVGFGCAGLLESPMLADRRRPFLQALLRQRAAAHGMTGVLSSSVELHSHQVEIVRRVLEDPVQRYLLADEVGLGKTIEAGMVIRQMLLDQPALRVQFVLPPFLLDQWVRELEGKFHIQSFRRADLRFARDDRPAEWQPADLLVVDEAHNLARLSASRSRELASRFERLREVALSSPRVLLLSATPVLHNEEILLAMLKLLDPNVYGDSSVEALRVRVEARSSLGRILLGLHAGLPAVLLRNRLAELGTLFSQDRDLTDILVEAGKRLEGGDREGLGQALRSIRVHVSEVYRLHRRMLRTRRTQALSTTYRVTGRRPPTLSPRNSEMAARIDLLLDSWRQELLAAAEAAGSLDEAAHSLAAACELASDPDGLREWAVGRARGAITATEREALERLARGVTRISRREEIARPIADALSYELAESERMVVFCPTTGLARDLAAELRDLLGDRLIVTHLSGEEASDVEEAVLDFERAEGSARLLVCDASAEEGRNFQFADVLVHLGLPSDANRLEQRIGRFDRWSHVAPGPLWRSLIIGDPESSRSLPDAWRRILAGGFEIFDRSVASLQHAVDAASAIAWQALLLHGWDGVADAQARVRQALQQEVERIREQDALDAIEAVQDERSVFEKLAQVERDEEQFAGAADELLADRGEPGNLRFQKVGNAREASGVPIEGHTGTFRRSVAVRTPALQIYRQGAPLIDAVADFLWHDDRGRSYGMWRWLPGWDRPERPAYRFDYHIEAAPEFGRVASEHATGKLDARAVQRRADALFPPVIVSLWLDERGQLITDCDFLAALERPYRKPQGPNDPHGGDFSLNKNRIAWAYDFIPEQRWPGAWREAQAEAEQLVRSHPAVMDAVAKGTAQAGPMLEGRIRQIRLRALRVPDEERAVLEHEVALEEAIAEVIHEAIRQPQLRLDSTGFVLVSGAVPSDAVEL